MNQVSQQYDNSEISHTLLTRGNFIAGAAIILLTACATAKQTTPGNSFVTSGETTITGGSIAGPNTDAPQITFGKEVTLPALATLDGDPQLSLLEKYQREVGVAPRMMEFIGFPRSNEDATQLAASMAKSLHEWHLKGARPIVIMEPTFNGGRELMNLEAFSRGKYNTSLNNFFDSLKNLGVTDEMMGTWVPFPEPNDPGWANDVTNPQIFTQNVTRVAKVIKGNFPSSPVSIMLDNQTSLKADFSDSTQDPAALLPYLNIETGLIDSFGLQGFTWDNNDSPSNYLSAKAAITSAKQLGIKNVWFNTGTYSVANNPNGKGIIKASDTRRAAVLQATLSQVLEVQNAGLTIDFINVFAENKYDKSPEGLGTADNQYATPEALKVLKEFVLSAAQHDIPVTIFDTAKR